MGTFFSFLYDLRILFLPRLAFLTNSSEDSSYEENSTKGEAHYENYKLFCDQLFRKTSSLAFVELNFDKPQTPCILHKVALNCSGQPGLFCFSCLSSFL